jgi:hypothetical protein
LKYKLKLLEKFSDLQIGSEGQSKKQELLSGKYEIGSRKYEVGNSRHEIRGTKYGLNKKLKSKRLEALLLKE